MIRSLILLHHVRARTYWTSIQIGSGKFTIIFIFIRAVMSTCQPPSIYFIHVSKVNHCQQVARERLKTFAAVPNSSVSFILKVTLDVCNDIYSGGTVFRCLEYIELRLWRHARAEYGWIYSNCRTIPETSRLGRTYC